MAMTVETGEGHVITDDAYAKLRRDNMPALWDLAALTERPAQSARGPVPTGTFIEDGKIGAWISDARGGKDAIAGAELVFDPKTPPGKGMRLRRVTNPDYGTPKRWEGIFEAKLPKDAPDSGLAFVRGRDSKGNWGVPSALWMRDPEPKAPTESVAPDAGPPRA